MDRRGFLRAAFGLGAAPFLPMPVLGNDGPWGFVPISWYAGQRITTDEVGSYIAFVHPNVERDLRDMAARDQWRDAYREWRRAGRPPIEMRDLVAKYSPRVMHAEIV